MKLNIAQNLRKYRKDFGMTQEQLAKELGISSQSVSKWECGDGYPDIELLPNIANHLKISVDALLGNDSVGKKEDLAYFWEQIHKNDGFPGTGDLREQRVQFAEAYWRKYPDEYRIAAHLVQELSFGSSRNLEEYRPLLYGAAEKVIEECPDPLLRGNTLKNVCCVCPDDELDRWLSRCTYDYKTCRFEVLEQRYWENSQHDKALEQHLLNNLKLACHTLVREIQVVLPPEPVIAQQKERRRLIESFAEADENVPQGWLPFYAGCGIRMAAAYFGKGDEEEAYALLDRSFEEYAAWRAFPEDAVLDLGRHDLFGGIRTYRNSWFFLLPDGTKENDLSYLNILHYANSSLDFLASVPNSDWRSYEGIPIAWFKNVAQTSRFREYAARAETLLGCPSTVLRK